MSDLSGGVWVRALGLEERLVAAYNTAGNMTIAHALWLSSNTPLTHSILSNALWALYRAVPSLQLCVRTNPKTNNLWFYRPETTTAFLDLQEVRDRRFSDVYRQVLHRAYSLHRAPVWCVRYLNLQHNIDDSYPHPPEDHPLDYYSCTEEDGNNQEKRGNCNQFDLVSKDNNSTSSRHLPPVFPGGNILPSSDGVILDSRKMDVVCNHESKGVEADHKYIVIFGFSHVITDGVSNMRISHHLLQFLKKEVQIAAGREKEESRDSEKDAVEELGVFTSPVAEEQAMERKERDAEFASIACSGPLPGPALYMTLYPPHTTDPAAASTETIFLPGLTEAQTSTLRRQCRIHGVTVHAAFTAAASLAMLQLLGRASKGYKERVEALESLVTVHDINLRRYWLPPIKDAMGLHAAICEISLPTPVREAFFYCVLSYIVCVCVYSPICGCRG
ncbi:uncharacterized protein [Cherax quadricarinatus]